MFRGRATDGSTGRASQLSAASIAAASQYTSRQYDTSRQYACRHSTSRPVRASSEALLQPGICLSAFSDSGAIGDAKTSQSAVNLVGFTSPNARVRLKGTGHLAVAGAKGSFLFTNVSLKTGENDFTVIAHAGSKKSRFDTAITRVPTDRVNPVVAWNANALRAILTAGSPPPVAARNLAIVHTAVFDAVNSIADRYKAYRVNLDAPAGASVDAAAVSAAYRTLSKLYPAQKATFDAAYAASLAKIPDGQSETDGVAIGQTVADTLLTLRSGDGANKAAAPFPASTTPGQWRPSPPGFAAAALPLWKNVTPFAMTSGSQFRPAPPPSLTTQQRAKELNQVAALGRLHSRTRTADQTQSALFWADGGNTFTPPGHWNQIIEQIATKQKNTTLKDARLFALSNIAMADAGIAAWDAKYTYDSWRPIDAIRLANTDGNPLTKAAPQWNSLLTTPNHPDYVSGHSSFSGAAAEVLTSLLGNFSFTSSSIGLPGVSRSYTNFREAADEAGMSRIYGGIHTMSANRAGKAIGRSIADYVVKNFLTSA